MRTFELEARRYGKSLAIAYGVRPGCAVISATVNSAVDLLGLIRDVQGESVARSVRMYASTGIGTSVRVLPTSRRR